MLLFEWVHGVEWYVTTLLMSWRLLVANDDARPGWGGGLSEHVVAPEYAVYKLPDNVPLVRE